jgi:para-nitrobenzyl esterase
MIRRISLVVVVVVASAAVAVAPFHAGQAVASPGLVVQTADGAVQGVVAGTEAEWRGIPYAAPPLGALRWQPPQPVTPWPGVRDATQFTPPCIQNDGSGVTLAPRTACI